MYIYTLNSGLMEMVFIYLLKCIFCKKLKNQIKKKQKINLSLLDQNLCPKRMFLFINNCSAARLA